MAVSTYTTYDAVRTALGVSASELKDEVIEVETLAFEIEEQLIAIKSTLIDDFRTVSDKEEEVRTAAEQSLYRRVRLFGGYACAWKISTGLGLLASQEIGDGKALVTRFSDSPYRDVIQRLYGEYQLAYQRLNEVANNLFGIVPLYAQYWRRSSLSRDPVVSE